MQIQQPRHSPVFDAFKPLRLLDCEDIFSPGRILVANFHRTHKLSASELVNLDELALETTRFFLVGRRRKSPSTYRGLRVRLPGRVSVGVWSLRLKSGEKSGSRCTQGRCLTHATLTLKSERQRAFDGRIQGGDSGRGRTRTS